MADDFDELLELAKDLTDAPAEVAPFVKKALKGTAMEIKKGWTQRAEAVGSDGVPSGYAESIDFDERDTDAGPEVEIGPNPGKRGGKGGFLDEPLSSGGLTHPPVHAGRAALEAAEPDFYRGLEHAVADGLAKALGAS